MGRDLEQAAMSRQRWTCVVCKDPVELAIRITKPTPRREQLIYCLGCLREGGGFIMPASAEMGASGYVEVLTSDWTPPVDNPLEELGRTVLALAKLLKEQR